MSHKNPLKGLTYTPKITNKLFNKYSSKQIKYKLQPQVNEIKHIKKIKYFFNMRKNRLC